MKYRTDIDGLRAIAVLAVVSFHAFPTVFRGGFIGVDIFFVISGYLISGIILQKLANNTFTLTDFYARRIKRIFPALILVILATLLFGWFALLADELNQLGKHTAAGASFISNLVLWGEDGYFDNAAETKTLLHLWSLGIEEQFYILWPVLLWVAWRTKINLLLMIILCGATSFMLGYKGIKVDPVGSFYAPQTRVWELLFGSLLAWLSTKSIRTNDASREHFKIGAWIDSFSKPSNIAAILGAILLVYGFWRIDNEVSFPGQWALIPVLGATLILRAGPQAWINRYILSNKLLVWFGLISFPLYLWHWPILSFGRIIYNDTPSLEFRLMAVACSTLLAWLTFTFLEKPIRFGNTLNKRKVPLLCGLMALLGVAGMMISSMDFSQSHSIEKLVVKRKESKQIIGYSAAWFRGKEDWLFLGNASEKIIDKLELVITPDEQLIADTSQQFNHLAKIANEFNTKVALIIGPNKSSIYSEYLPSDIVPSSKRYISFFLDQLKDIPNLTIYDPTDSLIALKDTEGLLYWMTDTHWNKKGAYFAYCGLNQLLGLPIPDVQFNPGSEHKGDLIRISKLTKFTFHKEDNWDVTFSNKLSITEKEISDERKSSMGSATVVINKNPLSDKYVWVVGDSSTEALKPYINATFKEVRYVGHWMHKLKNLSFELSNSDRKPDLIIIVKVERSF